MKANFLFTLLFLFLGCQKEGLVIPPQVVAGTIDLRDWNFEKVEVLELKGEWEFYWQKFFSTKTEEQLVPAFVKVPGEWQNYGFDALGYATYRVKIVLPKDIKPLSIDMRSIACSYQLYLNGELLGNQGKVGKTKKEAEPFLNHQILHIPVTFYDPSKPEIELVLNVSNFHYFRAGIWDTVSIGLTKHILKEEKKKFVIDVIVLSCLFLMGLYHLGLFFTRKADKSPLYFSVFVILIAIRTASINERMIMDLFPGLSFEFVSKLEYLTVYISGFVFLAFVESLFPEEAVKKWSRWLNLFFIPPSLLVVFYPMYVFGQEISFVEIGIFIEILYVGWMLFLAVSRKRVGAKLFVSGFVILSATAIHDILKGKQIVYSPYLMGYGLLTFIVFQAAILSRKFAIAYLNSEELANELKLFSRNLEAKVKSRTAELQTTLEQIKELKYQQDGDYFLTSQLLKPLNSNKSISETCKIESLSSQKKKFQFREWQEEIGGDLCMANDIVLKGKKYVVFVNADAMGKSLQGASGALVFGSVFESIINRNRITPNSRNVFPERWIKDAFIELHHVFETFDGSMLVSLVMGLIEEQTGILFMINADHPPAILYRDGIASFLGHEKSFRKLGTLGANGLLHVFTTQLHPGDTVILGSDGRDDLLITEENGSIEINENDSLILTHTEKAKADLKGMLQEMMDFGSQYDDLTLLKITYDAKYEKKDVKESIQLYENHFKSKKYEKALEVVDTIWDEMQADTEFLYQVSYAHRKAKNYASSCDIGERVRLRDPYHLKNLINLTAVHEITGNKIRANELLKFILKLDPENKRALRKKKNLFY